MTIYDNECLNFARAKSGTNLSSSGSVNFESDPQFLDPNRKNSHILGFERTQSRKTLIPDFEAIQELAQAPRPSTVGLTSVDEV